MIVVDQLNLLMSICDQLLELGLVEAGEVFDAYCVLIEANRDRTRQRYSTARHHVIPRSYYKHASLPIDNTDANLVYLLHQDHARAHYYLSLCAKPKWFQEANINALRYITTTKSLENSQDFMESWLPQYQALQEERNQQHAKRMKELKKGELWCQRLGQAKRGRIAIYKEGVKKYIDPQELALFSTRGWSQIPPKDFYASRQGRPSPKKGKPQSAEERAKHLGVNRGRIHVHNNVVAKFIRPEELPEYLKQGYQLGRLPTVKKKILDSPPRQWTEEDRRKSSQRESQMVHVVKGEVERKIKKVELEKFLKEGWVRGRSPKTCFKLRHPKQSKRKGN